MEVNDANGNFLGLYLGCWFGSSEFYIPSLDAMLTVSMKNGNMDDIPLYFQSDDCSGVAYVAPISSINIGRNRKKYYVGEKTVPTRMQVNSLLGRDKCYKHNAEEDLVLAQKATLPFPVPVALPFDFHLNN